MTKKNKCPECYASDPVATPLHGPETCLPVHRQYICRTCGRHICMQRWRYPFKRGEEAMLYVRSAEAETKTKCAVYAFEAPPGRIGFKIFPNDKEYEKYIEKKKFEKAEEKIYFKPNKSLPNGHKNIRIQLTQKEADEYYQKWKKSRNL